MLTGKEKAIRTDKGLWFKAQKKFQKKTKTGFADRVFDYFCRPNHQEKSKYLHPNNIMDINIIIWLDYIGTAVFAISGVLTAGSKKLDLFGALFIGVVTAIGGGTVRDLLLGVTPVTWLQGYGYLIAISGGFLVTFFFKRFVARMRRTLFLFDTIGIGVFTIIGLEKALNLGVNPAVAVIMGMTSAVVGGVIRDTLTNEVPLIFHKEIYATACITGAVFYLLFNWLQFPAAINELLTVGIIITIRLLSIRYNIVIPVFRTPES